MARIRSVLPGLWTDEAFVSVSDAAKLLFIGLWGEADDSGFFEWKPLTIKMRLRAGSAETAADIQALMDELAAANMIRRFSIEGRALGGVRNFARFQRPKSPKGIDPIDGAARLFVGLSADGQRSRTAASRPAEDETPELFPPNAEPLPPKAEKSPQMEEVVVTGRRLGNTTTTTSREDDFALAAIEAAGEALGDPTACADLASPDELDRWQAGGCEPETDVLATIRRLVRGKPPGSVKTWRFFSEAIFEARNKRLSARAPPPVIDLAAHQPKQRIPHERQPKRTIVDALFDQLDQSADRSNRA